ncbi:MAG: circularly permuted type 2 ATP-grasp protein [Planctomycetota bacterium]
MSASIPPTRPTADSTDPLQGYTGKLEHYDEAVERGRPRPAWQPLAQQLLTLGREEVNTRWSRAQRTLVDNGVTYNLHGGENGEASTRSWLLDPLPLVIPAEEWSAIEAAVAQRVTLLNTILDDLYGPQALLKSGKIPSELVWANRGFHRPLHNVPVAGGRRVMLYAADLGRSQDGRWWVISDRTQAPSGTGYALENRVVTARVWPQVFRDSRIARLAPFFAGLRNTLRGVAPQHRDDPSIVMLTPGPYAATYFEHAYLARYLGLPLVEGRDLTVRDERVYLKTLSGLHPVDVIIRRVDDDYCDPLELREDSALGVTGLVRAIRAGRVAMANALGTGIAEAAGMMPFHQGLCRDLLGEALKMPSVATWWCGQAKERQHVIDNLSKMVIKPAFRAGAMEPVFGEELSMSQRSELLGKISARPHMYVGQEWLPLSSAPVWNDGSPIARRVMLRVFAASDGRGGYRVMPGGMARVASPTASHVVTMQRGGGSKDTWVVSNTPVERISLLPAADGPVPLVRGGVDLPSRVAEDLFWLARYLERVSNTIRLVRETLRGGSDESDSDGNEVRYLLQALAIRTGTEPTEDLPYRILTDRELPVALPWLSAQAKRLAGSVRDVISDDMWRIFSRMDREIHAIPTLGSEQVSLLDLLDEVLLTVSGLVGLAHDGMTRGHSYWFLELGRRIEIAHFLSVILVPMTQGSPDPSRLTALLQICDSIKTYRSRYRTLMAEQPVCDLLVLDQTNPRSLGFQLAELHTHIENLPRSPGRAQLDEQQRIVLEMLSRVRLADAASLCEDNRLGQLLGDISQRLLTLSDSLTGHYLAHALPPSQPAGPPEPMA